MILETEKNLKSNKERETLFRVTYRNQTSLRQIVDNKANMVISINTLIISSIIAISGYGILSNKMDLYLQNLIPISIIMVSCLISAVFAILAANPKFLKPDLKRLENKQSLLFFGEIADYSQEEYIKKMEDLLASKNEIYKNMIIDLHCQGIILKYKFNYISHAYKILMLGFGLGVTFFLVFLFFQ
jgi:hypothetical protein